MFKADEKKYDTIIWIGEGCNDIAYDDYSDVNWLVKIMSNN